MKNIKGIMKTVGDVLSPNDPALVEKTLKRLDEQDGWNDVFSTKLIEVLDSLDAIKTRANVEYRRAREARESYLKAKRLVVSAVAPSWFIAPWAIWFSTRPSIALWVPIVASVLIVAVYFVLVRRPIHES